LAAHAFATTAVASASAMLTWMLIDVHETGKPTLVGASTGLVVGLVAITPGTGFVPIWSSFLIGALVSPVCYFCVSRVKKKFGYDDALDAFGCHGVGGIYGGIMTGLFGSKAVNPALVSDGLVFGDTKLFLANLVGTVVTILLGLVGGGLCIFLTKRITPLRVSEKEEKIGLDITQHGERAYPSFNGLDD
ncbi:MAG: ammonia permease, partial [Eubacteriales bacterium]|nr:ammonia permease [Eubacteriales bacterium]